MPSSRRKTVRSLGEKLEYEGKQNRKLVRHFLLQRGCSHWNQLKNEMVLFCVLNSAEEPEFPLFYLYPLRILPSLPEPLSGFPVGPPWVLKGCCEIFMESFWTEKKNPNSSAWGALKVCFLNERTDKINTLAFAYPEFSTSKVGISYKLSCTTPHSRVSLSHKGIDIAIYM